MATPRYQFRLDELREWARDGARGLSKPHPADRTLEHDQHIDDLTDRVQALAQELLRLRRREVLRMGGFER